MPVSQIYQVKFFLFRAGFVPPVDVYQMTPAMVLDSKDIVTVQNGFDLRAETLLLKLLADKTVEIETRGEPRILLLNAKSLGFKPRRAPVVSDYRYNTSSIGYSTLTP